VPDAVVDTSLLSVGRSEFELFRSLIHRHTGIWLRDGKQVMLAARLSRRLRQLQLSSFADYYDYVENCQDGGAELAEMINCVTTNKTAFFRERHHFDFLADVVVPERLKSFRLNKEQGGLAKPAIRVWSAACSTGEEPYSIAITLLEAHVRWRTLAPGGWSNRIVASDIDTSVLGQAQRGVYSDAELENIDPGLHKKYLLRGTGPSAGQIKVKKAVAAPIDFLRINLMDSTWPLRESFDAIFFRNALIYFKQETQDLFLRRMARLLNPGGYLFLGHSEHIPWLQDIFEPMLQTIYRLRSAKP
jgi:chemotaxis protein methyltransferase CheR